MNIDDEEILELRKAGHKVTVAHGKPKDAPKPAEPAKPSDMAQIATELREFFKTLKALADRPASEAPEVHVAAPRISLSPEIHVKTARVIECEVTERDRAERIKKIKFTVLE